MKRLFFFTGIGLLALSLSWTANSHMASQPSYRITNLSIGSFRAGMALNINNRGQIVGRLVLPNGENRAWLFADDLRMDMNTLGGSENVAYGINDAGHVVGASYIANNGAELAFLFDGLRLLNLGTLGGVRSVARAINQNDIIVGQADTLRGPRANPHAFIYQNGRMQDLGTLGGASSTATDINVKGQVTGYSQLSNGNYHAFLYSNGTLTDLGALNGGSSLAWSLNDAGVVVGISAKQGFIYERGTMKALHGLNNFHESSALGINNLGHVVGAAFSHVTHRSRAFLYRDGAMHDLNDLIPPGQNWELTKATSINDAGQIVGEGLLDRKPNAFLLTPLK